MKFNNDAIRELSYGALSLQEGSKEAYAWHSELKSRKSFLFAWQTELINPKYIPDWVRLKDADMECEIPWNSLRGQEFRECDWKRKTGIRIVIKDQIYYSNRNTHPKLVEVPTKKNTRELFTDIIKTIPPAIFEWCDTFKKLFPTYKDEGIFLIDRKNGLDILPGVFEFIIAEPFARDPQSQSAPFTLSEIQSPLPEIETYEHEVNERLTRRVRRPPPQENNNWILGEEVMNEYRDEFERVLQEFEDRLAAEEARLDTELQDAMKEYHATQQSERKGCIC